jgi:Putative DNA-binding domain
VPPEPTSTEGWVASRLVADFTALHQALGLPPGPITDDILNDAVAKGVEEADQLDWKRALPAEDALANSDVPKDIAAFANSGGGALVYGVEEEQRKAVRRLDVGDVSESYERTYRRVAVSGIHPPVFNLRISRVGENGGRALVVVVPPSVEVPHLIYRNDFFGAPVRNHADTEWMRERQLEAMYRQRLDERRNFDRALDDLYAELAAGRDSGARAWLVAVAHPRVPVSARQQTQSEMRWLIEQTVQLALGWVPNTEKSGVHPLEMVDRGLPRRGLRRWIAPAVGDQFESWMGVHDNGAVSIATALGGRSIRKFTGWEPLPGSTARTVDVETILADFMALLRIASSTLAVGSEYDVMVGIEWAGEEPLLLVDTGGWGDLFEDGSTPLARFTPVRMSVRTDVDDDAYLAEVYELARDAINQGGVQNIQLIPQPEG